MIYANRRDFHFHLASVKCVLYVFTCLPVNVECSWNTKQAPEQFDMSDSDNADLSLDYFITETNVQMNVNMYCLGSFKIQTVPHQGDIFRTIKKPHCILSKLTRCTTFRIIVCLLDPPSKEI